MAFPHSAPISKLLRCSSLIWWLLPTQSTFSPALNPFTHSWIVRDLLLEHDLTPLLLYYIFPCRKISGPVIFSQQEFHVVNSPDLKKITNCSVFWKSRHDWLTFKIHIMVGPGDPDLDGATLCWALNKHRANMVLSPKNLQSHQISNKERWSWETELNMYNTVSILYVCASGWIDTQPWGDLQKHLKDLGAHAWLIFDWPVLLNHLG